MSIKKVSSRKKRISAPRLKKAAKRGKSAGSLQRAGHQAHLLSVPKRTEPVIDRERELALLESATKEPC